MQALAQSYELYMASAASSTGSERMFAYDHALQVLHAIDMTDANLAPAFYTDAISRMWAIGYTLAARNVAGEFFRLYPHSSSISDLPFELQNPNAGASAIDGAMILISADPQTKEPRHTDSDPDAPTVIEAADASIQLSAATSIGLEYSGQTSRDFASAQHAFTVKNMKGDAVGILKVSYPQLMSGDQILIEVEIDDPTIEPDDLQVAIADHFHIGTGEVSVTTAASTKPDPQAGSTVMRSSVTTSMTTAGTTDVPTFIVAPNLMAAGEGAGSGVTKSPAAQDPDASAIAWRRAQSMPSLNHLSPSAQQVVLQFRWAFHLYGATTLADASGLTVDEINALLDGGIPTRMSASMTRESIFRAITMGNRFMPQWTEQLRRYIHTAVSEARIAAGINSDADDIMSEAEVRARISADADARRLAAAELARSQEDAKSGRVSRVNAVKNGKSQTAQPTTPNDNRQARAAQSQAKAEERAAHNKIRDEARAERTRKQEETRVERIRRREKMLADRERAAAEARALREQAKPAMDSARADAKRVRTKPKHPRWRVRQGGMRGVAVDWNDGRVRLRPDELRAASDTTLDGWAAGRETFGIISTVQRAAGGYRKTGVQISDANAPIKDVQNIVVLGKVDGRWTVLRDGTRGTHPEWAIGELRAGGRVLVPRDVVHQIAVAKHKAKPKMDRPPKQLNEIAGADIDRLREILGTDRARIAARISAEGEVSGIGLHPFGMATNTTTKAQLDIRPTPGSEHPYLIEFGEGPWGNNFARAFMATGLVGITDAARAKLEADAIRGERRRAGARGE